MQEAPRIDPGPYGPLTRGSVLAFAAVAWIGVLTTAANTGMFLVPGGEQLGALRNAILLAHAPATLLPVIAIALIGFSRAPFAATTAIVFTSLEKALEFVGQTLLVFPPEETIGPMPGADLVRAVWDQLFFVLWCCNTVGATAAGYLMFRIVRGPWRWAMLAAGVGAALLTLILLLGPDYIRAVAIAVPPLLFFAVFTGYRLALASALSFPIRRLR